ncbi:hypothetical protein ACEUDG_09635 [Aeromonas rivipollensis]|uniref:hypothetical protein n=1 Tax=Aeromonas rivipollensis TaxID=948519 RepID=UPI0038CF79B6
MNGINYQNLASRVSKIQDWRFMPNTEIAKILGIPSRSLQISMIHMQAIGLLPAKSPVQGPAYRNYQRVLRYLESHPGQVNLTVMAEEITGYLCSGANLKCFRNALAQAKAEGLPLDYDRIEDVPRPRSTQPVERKSKVTDSKPRFVDWEQVDPEHRQRFVSLYQFVGGRHAA